MVLVAKSFNIKANEVFEFFCDLEYCVTYEFYGGTENMPEI